MSVRADTRVAPLKAKQVRLLEVLAEHGPLTIRAAARHIHGDDSPGHVISIHKQSYSLRDRGLIRPAKTGERERGNRGAFPLLWVAVEAQA